MNEDVDNLVWLSYPLDTSTPSYGNGEGFNNNCIKNVTRGDSCNTSRWQLTNHIGTHIDSPNHFFSNGKSIDDFPPDFWFFSKISVIKEPTINEKMGVEVDDKFENLSKETDLLLIYTGFSKNRNETKYWRENPGLSSELAIFLRRNYPDLRAVGIDSISISSWQNREEGRKAHQSFLNPEDYGNPILLIEDMDLSILEDNVQILSCCALPIRVKCADGAPCTVVAGVKRC
ncbi:cyclase family protein [Methanococcoides orientis]|uniref:cyclase family protein n=1 Tax=Methanococcoides orientis TaxID=2822137 RepID=UPI001E5B3372|nr:cyclase family protein [Methanococcoides orientis]UGV40296.1 cyclase family protein [Methanococcoides orientis]